MDTLLQAYSTHSGLLIHEEYFDDRDFHGMMNFMNHYDNENFTIKSERVSPLDPIYSFTTNQ